MDNNTYTLNEKEFKINDISNNAGSKVFEADTDGNLKITGVVEQRYKTIVGIDTNKGCLKIARESSDEEVLELLNNTVNDDESYEDINKDIDYELLQDVIKDDIIKCNIYRY